MIRETSSETSSWERARARGRASAASAARPASSMVQLAPTVLVVALLALAAAGVQSATAQVPIPNHPIGQAPALPQGPASVHGRVLQAGQQGGVSGVPISLLALGPDGMPGVGRARSDTDGRFSFEGVSNDPGVSYLVSARYAGIAFRQRARFESGQSELQVEIRVADRTEDASELTVDESLIWLDWVGSDLRVREAHRLQNAGERVIQVAEERRAGRRPPFESRLPAGASHFEDAQAGFGAEIVRDGDQLGYWGPFYPGEQEIRYQYLVQPERGADRMALHVDFPSGTGKLTILSPEDAPPVEATGLHAGEAIDRGPRAYRTLVGTAIEAGGGVDLALALPESRSDPSAIHLPQANIWLDLDDTAMLVSVETKLQVDSTTRLLARQGENLVHLMLPPDASFVGMSSESEAVGAMPADEGGGLDVLGPLPPGETVIAYRYRVPVADGRAQLDLAFDRELAELNVLVADTGVVVESRRLHRRRPFVSGERFYLHHQAYRIRPHEKLEIDVKMLQSGSRISRVASSAGVLGLAVLAALFLIAPLRGRRDEVTARDAVAQGLETERESVYASLADLEQDFETGKLESEEYERMRGELRAAAVELLRRERELHDAALAASPREAGPGDRGSASARFCPHCGDSAPPEWRFCSHCGATLSAAEGETPV